MIKNIPALVIDVTYQCNASCSYCQWGSPATGRKIEYNLRLPMETLSALGTKRVVFSGGEPLLRADLEELISYYRTSGVDSVVVITNGLLLSSQRFDSLLAAGITGVTASLDGVTPEVAANARGMSRHQQKKIMENFEHVLEHRKQMRRTPEFVINTVLSKANMEFRHLAGLVDFGNLHEVDYVKFTPVFDDGYLGKRAPWLKFQNEDSALIRALGRMVVARAQVKTNPPWFWNAVADIVGGSKKLKGSSCGLDKGQALFTHGELKFCAWLKQPIYGRLNEIVSSRTVREAQSEFRQACVQCETGAWCFCLQDLEQQWEIT